MKTYLKNAEKHLAQKLKNTKFRELYELERANVALAQKFAEIREASSLNQAELAKKMHVSQQVISQIESGKRNLTIGTLCKLSTSLGRSVKISFSKKSSASACLRIV
ncbi:MAG: helix-turn-helix transcriptional regulator [Elusimicrobiales bacterium]|nr:helix-turn-helix transcriptional regulator [Elusimicrobiales bacterium]